MSVFIILRNDWINNIKEKEKQFINAFSDIRSIISFFTELIEQEKKDKFLPYMDELNYMSMDDLILLTKNGNYYHYFFINVKEEDNDNYAIHRFNSYTYPREYNLLLNTIEEITGIDY